MGLFDQEQTTISSLKKEKGSKTLEGKFLVREVNLRMGQGGPYLSFILMDRTGTVSASFFGGKIDGREVARDQLSSETLKEGIYRVRLRTQEGRANVVVESLETTEEAVKDYLIEPRAVYPRRENLREAFDQLAERNVKTPGGRRLYHLFWERHGEAFLKAPGGLRKHHAEEGGLALHTYMVLKIALFLGQLYGLDQEVIFLAGLLHDLGKIHEIGDGEFTREGDLLGHTVLSLLEAEKLCNEAEYQWKRRVNLLHSIASHHGQEDFGAPVSPKTLEAFVLHIADLADSKVYQFFKAIAGIGEGEESSQYFRDLARRVYLLDEE